jgi:transcription elongation factor Elf1
MAADIKCPVCGQVEVKLNLEETDGWLICSKCKSEVQISGYEKLYRIPVYTPEGLAKAAREGRL